MRQLTRAPERRGRVGERFRPEIARAVLAWFRRARRPLPWRASRDPYRIWVAEVLLQQTRVEQAAPYFERFVRRFPDVASLARAPTQQVLKAWEGAGYYARARRLRQAAGILVREHGGALPRTVDALERLPGVGAYTARAIGALAFDLPVVPLDANVLRVAARWAREERDVGRRAVQEELRARLERSIPSGASGAFAEGLMELGELVCRPRRPRCDACPVAFGCRAYRELAAPGRLPRSTRRPARPHVRAAVVALRHGSRWLVQRRPAGGLLGGLWEFPGGKLERGERPVDAARRELREETGVAVGRLAPVGVVRHGYSHFTVELHVFEGRARAMSPPARGRRWATLAEISRLPLPRATGKILGALRARRPRTHGRPPGRTSPGSR